MQDHAGRFARLGAFCVRRRRLVVTIWLIALCGLGILAPRLGALLTPGGFEISGSDSSRVPQITRTQFSNEFPSGLTAVIESETGGPNAAALVAETAARVRQIAAGDALVGRADAVRLSPGGRAGVVLIGLNKGLDDALPTVGPLLSALAAAGDENTSVRLTGGAAVFRDFDAVNARDLRRAELLQVPLVLLILLLVMGSLTSAAIPLVASGVALISTLGALWFAARGFDLTIYVKNIVPLVGIGVSVDYSLFIVTRFREELACGRDVAEAVTVTAATAGRAIFFSGLTVMVALLGMLAVRVPIFTSFAVGASTVVAFAVLTALTLVPAILAILGHRLLPRARPGLHASGGRMERWALLVMARPRAFLIGGVAVLLVLALPVTQMRLGSSGSSAIPADMPSIRASATIAQFAGPGAVAPIRVVIDGDDRQPRTAQVEAIRAAIRRDRDVVALTDSRRSDTGRLVLFETISAFHEDDRRSHALVERMREDIIPGASGTARLTTLVGGGPAQNHDFVEAVGGALPVVIALVMVLTFLVLVVLFRSIVLPLKAVVMTLLSALAAYGVLVAVFQWGWLSGLLGFTPLDHVTAWVPPFLFSMLFGLSMDYEVFLLTRIRERLDATGDQHHAIAWGVARSGRIITAAAAIMVVVFLAFVTSRLVPIKEAALGMAVAVLIDATLVRIVLVPAFMSIAGEWNWWLPRWLARLLDPAGPAEPAGADAAG